MKQTVKQTVEANREAALAAKTPQELRSFIESIGCGTKQRWGKAVAAIIEMGGVDFYAAKGEQRAASADALRAAVTHEITLYVDAKARCDHFGICGEDRKMVMHGRLFEDAKIACYPGYHGEQSNAEVCAALVAIDLAAHVKTHVGAAAVRLNLFVDAQWLCTLAGKAMPLASAARRHKIDLNVEWISGRDNPADAWTTASGYVALRDVNMVALARPIVADSAPVVPPFNPNDCGGVFDGNTVTSDADSGL